MTKNKINANSLIKSSSLRKALYARGVKRVNTETLEHLKVLLSGEAEEKLNILTHKLEVKGKKTLEKSDIKEVFGREGKEASWEI